MGLSRMLRGADDSTSILGGAWLWEFPYTCNKKSGAAANALGHNATAHQVLLGGVKRRHFATKMAKIVKHWSRKKPTTGFFSGGCCKCNIPNPLSNQIHNHAKQPQHHRQNTGGRRKRVQQSAWPFAGLQPVETGGGDLVGGCQQIDRCTPP